MTVADIAERPVDALEALRATEERDGVIDGGRRRRTADRHAQRLRQLPELQGVPGRHVADNSVNGSGIPSRQATQALPQCGQGLVHLGGKISLGRCRVIIAQILDKRAALAPPSPPGSWGAPATARSPRRAPAELSFRYPRAPEKAQAADPDHRCRPASYNVDRATGASPDRRSRPPCLISAMSNFSISSFIEKTSWSPCDQPSLAR